MKREARLPEMVSGYTKENIYNMDETGVFWRALPSKGFGEKGKACKGGKQSKHNNCCVLCQCCWCKGKAHFYLEIGKPTLFEKIRQKCTACDVL